MCSRITSESNWITHTNIRLTYQQIVVLNSILVDKISDVQAWAYDVGPEKPWKALIYYSILCGTNQKIKIDLAM